MPKLAANVSLDLDNKWSYMKTAGNPEWSSHPSYLPEVIPRILEILEQNDLKITVFVVGQDAALEKNHEALRMIVDAGHEIANHSFGHEPWLQRYSREELDQEFDRAETAIRLVTDQKLMGFRGPGYSLSEDVLEILCERGYQYDCSTFPTFLGPLARTYYFFKSKLKPDEDRKELFGSFWDGFRSLRPYRWSTAKGDMLEIPVTTIPVFRAPFHFSYVHYLAQYSKHLAMAYFRFAILMCKLTRTQPSLLLHPLDFLGGDEVKELAFFPGMKLNGDTKRALSARVLAMYSRSFDVTNMRDHSDRITTRSKLLKQKQFG